MRIGVLFFLFCLGCSPLLKKSAIGAQSTSDPKVIDVDCPLKFANVSLCAKLNLQEDPIEVSEPASALLYFWNPSEGTPDGPFIDPQTLGFRPHVRLWMPMTIGAHGTAPVALSRKKDDQEQIFYQIERMMFSMSGPWQIFIELKEKDGKKFDAVIQEVLI